MVSYVTEAGDYATQRGPSLHLTGEERMSFARVLIVIFLGSCYGWSAFAGEAGSTARRTVDPELGTVVILENEALKLAVAPSLGGRVACAIFKETGNDWIYPKGGLFLDHVTQQVWPGELLEAQYEFLITSHGPEVASVRLWRTIEGKGDKAIAGVVFEKELSLRRADPRLHAIVRLKNPTSSPRSPISWVQNCLYLGGGRENDRYFRPTTTGILEGWAEFTSMGVTRHGLDFVRNPSAGWSAVSDQKTGEGAVFLMDYNDLFWLYNCIGALTVEWWFDPVPLKPGAQWETSVTMIPFLGMKTISYADERMIAGVKEGYAGGRLQISLSMCSSSPQDLKNVEVDVAVCDFPERNVLDSTTFRLPFISRKPVEKVVSVARARSDQEVVTVVSVKAENYHTKFEKYFDPLAKQRAQFGEYTPRYRISKARKMKHFSLAKEARVKSRKKPKVLVFRGLHQSSWRIDEALKLLGAESVRNSRHTVFVYGDQLDYLPATPEELLDYNLVIVANVPADALTDMGQEFIKLYL